MNQNLRKLIIRRSKRMMHALILCCVGQPLLMAERASGQSIHEVKISVDFKGAHILEALDEIERKSSFTFAYNKEMRALDTRITQAYQSTTVAQVLKGISKETGVSFHQVNSTITAMLAPRRTEKPKANSQKPKVDKQDRIISGKVTDENGEPLIGATVYIKIPEGLNYTGGAIGSLTDAEGRFAFTLEKELIDQLDELVLTVSYVGYDTEEILLGNRTTVDVQLIPDLTSLREVAVVSTGYYEVEQRFNPGNIAKIDREIIERQPVVNPLEALQGQVAGVFIEQTSGTPGAPININIRGVNSLNNGQNLADENGNSVRLPNSNLPFFIIDGVPYTSTSLNSDNFIFGGGNPLAALRPGDIESIEVLKDADATAVYGSRGANGVVLITTKKGEKGKVKFDMNLSRGIGEVANKVDLLNTSQYLEMRREAFQNDGFVATDAGDSLSNADVFLWGESRNTDWQEELAGGTAEQTNASLTLSGGSAQTQFLFSGSFFRQTNVYNFDNSAFEGVSGHLNLNHTSRDNRFNINSSVTYSANTNNQIGSNLMGRALRLAPNAPPLFDEDGQLNFADNFVNPLAELERDYENKTRALVTNVSLRYELLPGLALQSALGYTNSTVDETNIIPLAALPPAARQNRVGQSSIGYGSEETWILEPQLTYSKEVGRSVFNTIIGATYQGSTTDRRTVSGTGYSSDLLIRDIAQAPTILFRENDFAEFRYTAVYTRLNYVYDEKYIMNLTGRRDGSSRFGPGRQFGNFGAIGTAWIFSEESFIEENSLLSFGKLRASYGVTGSDQIGNYGFLDSYRAPLAPDNSYNGDPVLTAVRAANPEFSWETNRKLEVGLELGFLEDRFNISTSWFRNRSDNQLIGRPLSAVTGFNTVQFNLPALVENRGIEIELNTININSGGFTWTSAFNITRLRNELVEFPNIEDFTPFDNQYIVGRSLFGGKQFRSLGVDPLTGSYAIVDLDGNGQIDINDQQDFVEVFQDYYGGFSNSFSWKGFQLDVFLRFVRQNGLDFATVFGSAGSLNSVNEGNQSVEILNRWQEPGDTPPFQRFTRFGGIDVSRHNSSSNTLVDASFIRLQNVSLSYNLPVGWITRLRLSQARVYVNGQNLYTWTPFDGLDPETGGTSLPPLRMITTGIQLTF